MSEDAILSESDAFDVGEKIIEMVDRVHKMEPIAPGATAIWILEVDGLAFEVKVRKAPQL